MVTAKVLVIKSNSLPCSMLSLIYIIMILLWPTDDDDDERTTVVHYRRSCVRRNSNQCISRARRDALDDEVGECNKKKTNETGNCVNRMYTSVEVIAIWSENTIRNCLEARRRRIRGSTTLRIYLQLFYKFEILSKIIMNSLNDALLYVRWLRVWILVECESCVQIHI